VWPVIVPSLDQFFPFWIRGLPTRCGIDWQRLQLKPGFSLDTFQQEKTSKQCSSPSRGLVVGHSLNLLTKSTICMKQTCMGAKSTPSLSCRLGSHCIPLIWYAVAYADFNVNLYMRILNYILIDFHLKHAIYSH
jgi:hypothetical protein